MGAAAAFGLGLFFSQEAWARGCEVGAHRESNVPRLPGAPETTARPRNPDEDVLIHCDGLDEAEVTAPQPSPIREHDHRHEVRP